ncbi:hypothetical protein D3C80_2007150 [compost metagenome]
MSRAMWPSIKVDLPAPLSPVTSVPSGSNVAVCRPWNEPQLYTESSARRICPVLNSSLRLVWVASDIFINLLLQNAALRGQLLIFAEQLG